jgi:hypothetical protein
MFNIIAELTAVDRPALPVIPVFLPTNRVEHD